MLFVNTMPVLALAVNILARTAAPSFLMDDFVFFTETGVEEGVDVLDMS